MSEVAQLQIVFKTFFTKPSLTIFQISGYNISYSKAVDQLQFDLLELKFFFSQFLGLGKTYRHIVTLKISLTSFHFRITNDMIQKSSDLALFFMDCLKNALQ